MGYRFRPREVRGSRTSWLKIVVQSELIFSDDTSLWIGDYANGSLRPCGRKLKTGDESTGDL